MQIECHWTNVKCKLHFSLAVLFIHLVKPNNKLEKNQNTSHKTGLLYENGQFCWQISFKSEINKFLCKISIKALDQSGKWRTWINCCIDDRSVPFRRHIYIQTYINAWNCVKISWDELININCIGVSVLYIQTFGIRSICSQYFRICAENSATDRWLVIKSQLPAIWIIENG